MIDMDNVKHVLLTPPQLKDNGDLASNTYVDTAGFGHVRFLIATGAIDAALGSTAETAAPKIEECDTTGGTYTAVSGAALAAAIPDTGGSKLYAIDVDLTKSHKRYMQVNAPHAGDGTNGVTACIQAILSHPIGNTPATAAERGLTEHIKA